MSAVWSETKNRENPAVGETAADAAGVIEVRNGRFFSYNAIKQQSIIMIFCCFILQLVFCIKLYKFIKN